MPQSIDITVSESGETHKLSGIPDIAWEKFTAAAKLHFPDAKEDAWARFLSEVIVAGSGGADTVTYFMTDVPRDLAEKMEGRLKQVGWSWDRFHAYLLRSVAEETQFKLISFSDTGKQDHMGTFIATGLKPEVFSKIAQVTGVSFERIMGTILFACSEGTLRFEPDAEFLTPTD